MRSLILLAGLLGTAVLAGGQPPPPTPPSSSQPLNLKQKEKLEKLKERDNAFAKMKEHRASGKFREAIAAAGRMLAIDKEVFGTVHAEVADTLAIIADLHEQLEDYSTAMTVAKDRLAVTIKLYGIEHWRTTDARLAVDDLVLKEKLSPADRLRLAEDGQQSKEAVKLYRLGNYREATDVTLNSLKVRKEILGDAHPDTHLIVNNLASFYQSMGRHTEAEPLYKEALAGCKKVLGDAHPNTLTSISNLARLYQLTNRYAEAEPLYKEALAGRKKVLGDAHPDTLTSISNMATVYSSMGRYAEAELLLKKALAGSKKILGDAHPDTHLIVNNLASLYKSMGRHTEAEALYKEALTGRKKTLGDAHPDTLMSLNNLGTLYQITGRYAEAEPLCKEALAGYKKALGDAHTNTLMSIHNLALLYDSTGRYAEAEPLHKDALAGLKKVLGDAHPNTLESVNSLAYHYQATDRYAKAEPLLLEAVDGFKKALGKEHELTLISLNNLAHQYLLTRRYAEAEPLYKQAMASFKKTLGNAHPTTITSVNNLAGLYQSMGRYAEAEPLYKEALASRKKTLGDAHPDTLGSVHNLAAVYDSMGRYAEAEPLHKEALVGTTDHLERTAVGQSEASQLAFADKQRRFFIHFLAGTTRSTADSAYALVFRWRGAVTARQAFARAARGVDPAAKTLLDDLTAVTRRLATLATNPPPPDKNVDITALMKSLLEQRDSLEGQLAARSAAFAGYVENRSLTPVDLQASLPADAALVDYVEYKGRLTAFVVRKTSIVRVELGDVRPVAAAADGFRRTLDRVHPTTGKPDDPAMVLRKQVWEPLAVHLKGARFVLLCPDGPLCRVPFAALPGADRDKYLIEEVALAVVPVPRLLPELLAERPAKGDAPPTLLAVGDVDFDADPSSGPAALEMGVSKWRRAGGPQKWLPLKGTAQEVTELEAMFRKAVPGGAPTVLRGSSATEAAVRAAAGKHQFLHIATHGFFDPFRPEKEARPAASMPLDRTRLTGPNPGLLSGIVLAGANKPDGADDGVLTALEVGDLDLGKVELAVLSACETGLGTASAGEGVLGLQRAFQVAGARTTVTTLWPIPDDATRVLMGRFYRNVWERNMGRLEALQEAQLWMYREGAKNPGLVRAGAVTARGMIFKESPPATADGRLPPYYWAAFTLAGDWR